MQVSSVWFPVLFAAPILAVLVVSGYGFLIFSSSPPDALVRGNGFPTRLISSAIMRRRP